MNPSHWSTSELETLKLINYTSEGVQKNGDGKDWQIHNWAIMKVFEENKTEDIVDGTITEAMFQPASVKSRNNSDSSKLKKSA